MQAMATMNAAQTLRSILDKLVFDPDSIYKDKSHLVSYCEEKILETYMRIVARTGTLNFDELVADVIMHNNEVIQMAATFLFNNPDGEECIGREAFDLFRCDIAKWMRDIEREEVSHYAPISNYIIKVLTKYNIAFVPYMEERYDDHTRDAFGIHGIVAVNDCQNMLFPQVVQTPSVDRLGLGFLDRLVFYRSCLDETQLLKGTCTYD